VERPIPSSEQEHEEVLMKRSMVLLFLVAVTLAVTSCAGTGVPYPGGVATGGWVYADVTQPSTNLSVAIDPTAKPEKLGKAKATSILGIVGTGDAGIQKAMESKGITKIHHVEHRAMHILGFYAEWEVLVYGE
jgi:hypothetical protein